MTRLVCFAHAGGGPATFRRWGPELPEDVELVAVRLPGRESRVREPAISAWGPLLQALTRGLQDEVAPPWVFLGHSLGAMIAYELACEWARRGCPPLGLVLVGCRAPHLPRLTPQIHHLPEAEFVGGLRAFSGTPPAVLADPRLLRLLAPMLRADMALAETWPPRPPSALEVPLVVYSGRDDATAPPPAVAAWARYARAGFTAHHLEGDHFSLVENQSGILDPLRPALTAWADSMA